MLDALNDYDWAEAFGEGTGGNCKPLGFVREDVAEILLAHEGENDGADWIFVGRLHDGRYAVVSAGCDYTGWDCQAGNSGWTYPDYASMLAGVGDEIRDLLGCPSSLQMPPATGDLDDCEDTCTFSVDGCGFTFKVKE